MGERKRRPRGDRKSTEMSTHLEETFAAAIRTELYPRSQIDIFIEVGRTPPYKRIDHFIDEIYSRCYKLMVETTQLVSMPLW